MSDQVQEIKNRIDIVDIIGEFVNLKRAGRNFKGLCPFHNEKSPSFMVNPELQIFKCFGCSESGDVFTFLQKHEGLEFPEALQILAKRAGVELKEYASKEDNLKTRLKLANFEAARFYNYVLLKHPKGKDALKYLLETRKLDLEIIKNFNIGFAPDEWSPLYDYLSKKKGFSDKEIEESGLSYRGRKGYVNRFRGRIIFPINDHRGSTIALAGRIMPNSDKNLAKYINSPETEIYKKSFSLYGIDKAKHEIKKLGLAILTEGELDMLSTYQIGIKNVVAVKGTALTQEQVTLLSRFARTIILALDADFAGDNAALRGINLAQEQEMEVKVCDMGKYKDPDEFAKDAPNEYKNALENAKDVWDYLIDLTAVKFDLNSGTGKSHASKFLLPFLNKISDPVMKDHYLRTFASKIKVELNVLSSLIKDDFKLVLPQKKKEIKENKTRRKMLEEDILRLSVNFLPEKLVEIYEIIDDAKIKRIVSLASHIVAKNKINIKKLSNSLPEEVKNAFNEIMLNPVEEEHPERVFATVFKELSILDTKEKISEIALKIAEFEDKNKEKSLEKAKITFKRLTNKLQVLEEN